MIDLPAPMKAVAGTLPDDDDGWAYEIKWDGMRVVSCVEGDTFRAVSTRRLDVTARFPELTGLAVHLAGHTVVLDGEVVAFSDGRTDFSRLQRRMHLSNPAEVRSRATDTPVAYVVFDLLHLDGIDTMPLPYLDRRRLLEGLVEPGDGWLVPSHHVGGGTELLDAVTERGLEGLVAKRTASRYEPGRRSPAWRKVKVRMHQELVVGGWTEGTGTRQGRLGALLVGHHDRVGGPLRFAGAVGTGFDAAELDRLDALLAPLAVDASPFADPLPRTVRRPRFVRPEVVAEVEFAEWTPDGRLRHPAYLGRRIDADPRRVVREAP